MPCGSDGPILAPTTRISTLDGTARPSSWDGSDAGGQAVRRRQLPHPPGGGRPSGQRVRPPPAGHGLPRPARRCRCWTDTLAAATGHDVRAACALRLQRLWGALRCRWPSDALRRRAQLPSACADFVLLAGRVLHADVPGAVPHPSTRSGSARPVVRRWPATPTTGHFNGSQVGPGDGTVWTTPWDVVELRGRPYLPTPRRRSSRGASATNAQNAYDIASFTVEYRHYVPVS